MAKKTLEIERDGFRTVWSNGAKGAINVDVFQGETLVLEWGYDKLHRGLAENVATYLGQVILEAKSELAKKAKVNPKE